MDPNETHYDARLHHICILCSVKLWEIAQQGIEFDMRDQTIVLARREALQE